MEVNELIFEMLTSLKFKFSPLEVREPILKRYPDWINTFNS